MNNARFHAYDEAWHNWHKYTQANRSHDFYTSSHVEAQSKLSNNLAMLEGPEPPPSTWPSSTMTSLTPRSPPLASSAL